MVIIFRRDVLGVIDDQFPDALDSAFVQRVLQFPAVINQHEHDATTIQAVPA